MDDDAFDQLPLLNPPDGPDCLVCGPTNPDGLHLLIRRDGTDALARYTPRATHIGYPERVHGGLVGLLVDEMLVYAGAPHGLWGMTAKVRYWLRKPIPVGDRLELRARLVQRSDRGFRSVVSIRLPDESLAAEGEGMCVIRRTPLAADPT
ncbi:MAG TPA: hotdog fold domain-containing protein [Miltoncostaeaceae bacterium]|nr:hotdog fold domain-containing protein [Miltoncostaeaceae bacterium]